MKKSSFFEGASPNWYIDLPPILEGHYFGSISSVHPGETYLTYDGAYIVSRSRDGGKIRVRRNACAHAGAPLLLGAPGTQTRSNRVTCKLHHWTFHVGGELISAPDFDGDCKKVNLDAPPYGEWNGYIVGYEQSQLDAALASFGAALGLPVRSMHADNFIYMEEEKKVLPYPPDLMMVNFKDGLHVPRYHPYTFGIVADCETYAWEFSDQSSFVVPGYSIQLVKQKPLGDIQKRFAQLSDVQGRSGNKFGWADFAIWVHEVLLPRIGSTPIPKDVFAVWAAIYGAGYLMPEFYFGNLFLAMSYLVNVDPDNTRTGNVNMVEYYVHKSVPEDLREEAYRRFREAYTQSADEDDEICLLLWESHRRAKLPFKRVFHSLLEAGDTHWREWRTKNAGR